MHASISALMLLTACTDEPTAGGVSAIVDPTRPEHFFDLPFPSDELLRSDGTPDLAGFPATATEPAGGVVAGWASRLELTAHGWGNGTAAYFRFDGPLNLPDTTAGAADDPVLLVALDGSELLPLDLRFTTDPLDDPFLAENLLAMAPSLGHPMASGGAYAAVVMQSAGASPAAGYILPDGVTGALQSVGVSGEPAVATVFSVQDATGQLQALFQGVDDRLGDQPDWGAIEARHVIRLEYAQGLTESGNDATVCTATFEDGSTRTAYLAPLSSGTGDHVTELDQTWPMDVYELDIPVLNYQGLADRPYMRSGLSHILDVDETTGWIDFVDGQPTSVPEAESMRIVVSLPRGVDDAPVLVWDHGTGGHAYNSVQRRAAEDDGAALAAIFAEARVAVVGRDAALYGVRFPLIDDGYGGSLGFYNIVNPPAFRDNQRQTAVDGHVLRRFVETGLNDALPTGTVDGTRLLRFGHSMGSVTANLGLAADPNGFEAAFLSGSGGDFTEFFLSTGLLDDFDPSLVAGLFTLFGAEVPDEITPAAALGAALGLDDAAWAGIDRLHPVPGLFQWTMDPSDPLAVARDESLSVVLLTGIGDHQVPNFTSEALASAQPDSTISWCTPTWDYDPHYCLHREVEGQDALAAWLASVVP